MSDDPCPVSEAEAMYAEGIMSLSSQDNPVFIGRRTYAMVQRYAEWKSRQPKKPLPKIGIPWSAS